MSTMFLLVLISEPDWAGSSLLTVRVVGEVEDEAALEIAFSETCSHLNGATNSPLEGQRGVQRVVQVLWPAGTGATH